MADLKTYLGISDTDIKSVSGLPANDTKTILASKLNLLQVVNKMDYWANGLDADLLSLHTEVGTGGAVKSLPALHLNTAQAYVMSYLDNMLMLDGTAVYEFYLETIFDAFETTTAIISSKALTNVQGWNLSQSWGTGYRFYIKDSVGEETFGIGDTDNYWNIGLNKINIKFDLPNKQITLNINGVVRVINHTRSTVFDIYPNGRLTLGHPGQTKISKPVYLSLKKNDVITYEYMLGDNQANNDYIFNLIDGSLIFQKINSPILINQDLANSNKNGVDLYWHEKTLKYTDTSPVNSLGDSLNPKITDEFSLALSNYNLFKRLLPTDLSYHAYNYIEMPNLAIFDTTNRTYWKVAIESDPYYSGATVGKERWFHRTWLDFDWLNTHIEDAHKYKIFVQLRWQKAVGESDYTKIKIENIVLFNDVPNYYKARRDIYNGVELGNFYQSRPIFGAVATNGDKQIKIVDNNIHLSIDGGKTTHSTFDWSAIYPVNDISSINITNSGNICIFSKKTEVHYSSDNLATINASTVLGIDGNPYVFHTPANAAYPGGYFQILNSFKEDENCIVIGSYANAGTGANPVNLYYSIDDGVTWKVFYTYGQNDKYTDDGSSSGGIGGTLLGDALNTIVTTRVEGINIGSDGAFYVGTEGGNIAGNANSMLKCTYNSIFDTWECTSLINSQSMQDSTFRANGVWEYNGYIYWAPAGSEKGIYKSLATELNDKSKHISLSVPSEGLSTGAGCTVYDASGKVFVSYVTEIHLSADHGETWEIFTNKYNSNMITTFYDKINDWWTSSRNTVSRYIK